MEDKMQIPTMTTEEATEQLRALGIRISPQIIRDGLQQGAFPFGDCIQSRKGNNVYHIYRRKFEEWVAERVS